MGYQVNILFNSSNVRNFSDLLYYASKRFTNIEVRRSNYNPADCIEISLYDLIFPRSIDVILTQYPNCGGEPKHAHARLRYDPNKEESIIFIDMNKFLLFGDCLKNPSNKPIPIELQWE